MPPVTGLTHSRPPPETEAESARLSELVEAACGGDEDALNRLVRSLMSDVYRLALRMTGNLADAEDATQEVMIKVVTHLGSFRGDASVQTWTYRIAVRHLLDQKRGRIESMQLDFEQFSADLLDGLAPSSPEENPAAVEEVKLGCTLAMLTCLDREHRVAYILGEVFDLPGDVAATVADVTHDVYRQRLSRARRQLEAFTESYCGVVNKNAPCSCDRRVARAAELGRLQRDNLVLSGHPRSDVLIQVGEMESLHATATLFRSHPRYAAPERIAENIKELLAVGALRIVSPRDPDSR